MSLGHYQTKRVTARTLRAGMVTLSGTVESVLVQDGRVSVLYTNARSSHHDTSDRVTIYANL